MGGKGSSKIEVNQYQMSIHLGICAGPVDAISAAMYGEKVYWQGYTSENATYEIRQAGLFGGNTKEGGVQGPAETAADVALQAAREVSRQQVQVSVAVEVRQGGHAV